VLVWAQHSAEAVVSSGSVQLTVTAGEVRRVVPCATVLISTRFQLDASCLYDNTSEQSVEENLKTQMEEEGVKLGDDRTESAAEVTEEV